MTEPDQSVSEPEVVAEASAAPEPEAAVTPEPEVVPEPEPEPAPEYGQYHVGFWNALPNYGCPHCGFFTIDGTAEMQKHIDKVHPGAPEATKVELFHPTFLGPDGKPLRMEE